MVYYYRKSSIEPRGLISFCGLGGGLIERGLIIEGAYFQLKIKILYKGSFAFLYAASNEKSVLPTSKVYTYLSTIISVSS